MVINNPVINYHFFRAVDKAALVPALARLTRACRPTMAATEFKQLLFELQAAIDEAAEGAALSGASHLRLCAASKALHDAWEEQLPKGVRRANIERLAGLVNEAEAVARAAETRLATLRLPKSAKTPLMCFKDRHIPEFARNNPDAPVEAVQQLLTNAFARLSEEQRAPYEAAAAADLQRYTTALHSYQVTHAEAVRERQRATDELEAFRCALQNEW
jgi:hypothetical protein